MFTLTGGTENGLQMSSVRRVKMPEEYTITHNCSLHLLNYATLAEKKKPEGFLYAEIAVAEYLNFTSVFPDSGNGHVRSSEHEVYVVHR